MRCRQFRLRHGHESVAAVVRFKHQRREPVGERTALACSEAAVAAEARP